LITLKIFGVTFGIGWGHCPSPGYAPASVASAYGRPCVYMHFVDFQKAYNRVPREKLWGVLWEYGVDGRLLLALKSLYSCSEICIHVGKVNSQPFTVGVGLNKRVCCQGSFS